jgi:hypothetical protein
MVVNYCNRKFYNIGPQVSYNPFRYVTNARKYFTPYFTRKGDGPLGAVSGFDAIGNIR